MITAPQTLLLRAGSSVTPTPPPVCDPTKEALYQAECKSCDTDYSFDASTPAVCNSGASVKFFKFKVLKVPGPEDTLRSFSCLLELTHFQVNTALVPNLKTWLESNIRFAQASQLSSQYSFSVLFESIPTNYDPGSAAKISLAFKLLASKTVQQNIEISITFASYQLPAESNYFLNLVKMQKDPSIIEFKVDDSTLEEREQAERMGQRQAQLN